MPILLKKQKTSVMVEGFVMHCIVICVDQVYVAVLLPKVSQHSSCSNPNSLSQNRDFGIVECQFPDTKANPNFLNIFFDNLGII